MCLDKHGHKGFFYPNSGCVLIPLPDLIQGTQILNLYTTLCKGHWVELPTPELQDL